MSIKNAFMHLKTINKHKALVMKFCFRIGLYRQGLLHDMSKYSLSEFKTGMKYFCGYRSPNTVERLETGASPAWLHHKGRNKHHFEYWIDYDIAHKGEMIGMRMPYRYVCEMFCDRIAASKVYKGAEYKDSNPWEYYQPSKDSPYIHPETRKELAKLLEMLKDKGEDETFRFLKEDIKKRKKAYDHY